MEEIAICLVGGANAQHFVSRKRFESLSFPPLKTRRFPRGQMLNDEITLIDNAVEYGARTHRRWQEKRAAKEKRP